MAEQQMQSAKTNGMAIAAFVLSLVGLGVLGVIFGFVALNQIKKENQGGKGLAIAGIVIGFISIALLIVWLIFVWWAVDTATDIIQSPYYSNELINSLENLDNIQLNF
ncbi:MAG: DUF4190 domain-containing protein [bacterium]|nr:DUF4190 domain-containing protein [bacterium]